MADGRPARPAATWTVVGDPAQSSWPHPEEAAAGPRGRALRRAARAEPADRGTAFHLDTNYRNSAEIYRFAAAYAERVGLSADLPDAVRSTGVRAGRDGRRRARGRRPGRGRRAARRRRRDRRRSSCRWPAATRWRAGSRSWPEVADALAGGDAARLVVLTGLDTKGLEFDGIVVVEPEEIERESATGRATLYVVLTRATQRLVTVCRRLLAARTTRPGPQGPASVVLRHPPGIRSPVVRSGQDRSPGCLPPLSSVPRSSA